MESTLTPPAVKMTPPSLYNVTPERLHRARHNAANSLTGACIGGRRDLALRHARIVVRCDLALGIEPPRTMDELSRLIDETIEVMGRWS